MITLKISDSEKNTIIKALEMATIAANEQIEMYTPKGRAKFGRGDEVRELKRIRERSYALHKKLSYGKD